jgi:hypothetical protein
MSHVTDEKFCDGDPVWVWNCGAYYPGVIESLTPELGSAMIRWAAQAAGVPADANTRVSLDDVRPFAAGLLIGITNTVEEMYYQQMLTEGFDNVLERGTGCRTGRSPAAKTNSSAATVLLSSTAPIGLFRNVDTISSEANKTNKRKEVNAIPYCLLATACSLLNVCILLVLHPVR